MIGGAKGIGIGIDFGIPNQYCRATSKPYIEKDVLDSLRVVASAYGKSNNDAGRSIVKNLVDASNPFVISNAAYDKMSSYGGYEFAKFDNTLDWYNTEGNDSVEVVSRNGHSITLKRLTGPNFWYFQNSTFRGLISNVIPFKVNSNKNITVIWNVHGLSISEGKDKSVKVQELVLNPNEDNYTNLKTLNEEELAQIDISTNSLYYLLWFDLSTLAVDEEVTIEMLPLFEGAFVTDGIDDLITSTKTVQEMLGGSNEITVVSMAHFIKGESNAPEICRINQIRRDTRSIRNSISKIGKSGIFGYTYKNGVTTINNILGDKNDCTTEGNLDGIVAPFSVEGYYYNNNSNPLELCSIAWYWTIIANKVLTTDQINQVIAYFNLDRTLNPDILCNTIKQGITNENHAEFGDKLIDFSGNGRDIQMNNLAWKGGSGIAAKQGESIKDYSIIKDEEYQELTIYNEFKFKIKSKLSGRYWTVQYINRTNTSYPVTIVIDKDAYWVNSTTYYDADNNKQVIRKDIPIAADTPIDVLCCGYDQFDIPEDATSIVSAVSYINYNAVGEITVELIPSCEGGLITDGVNDFGKVTGLPAYKDYTTIIDYQRFDIGYIEGKGTTGILSKAHAAGQGAFLMNLIGSTGTHMNSYSFGTANANTYTDLDRQIYYQTKYKMQGFDMTAGTGVDGDSMWLALVRDNDSRFFNGAIYSLMSFPYSMSEFLIERQLKKHKLGTLYPDMVEFRPVIKANANYKITYYQIDSTNTWKSIKVGDYIVIGAKLAFQITFDNDASELKEVVSPQLSGIIVEKRPSNPGYNIYSYITSKSPQKINITIDEYIRFEDIVQPYPVVFQIKDRNTNQIYSWGDKIKVGSSIQLTQGENPNLLNGLYSIRSYEYEGKAYSYNQLTNLNITVTKQSISLSCNKIWLLDNNEPKVILSPRLLRIPNSSYKILGYIPDISGHGNHGKINNSAYAEGSGVNEDGSYQFNGVDDFVTIPTVTGGKQVLMKVNWDSSNSALLYDQRGYNNEFAIYNGSIDSDGNPIPAYSGRNNGQTYIDGILNSNIKASELKAITHNITITNELSAGVNNFSPVIGSNRLHNAYFVNMALYDFMLFDEISTDDKIKELNEYVGVEAKVELPPYYWDTYGKTNSDADRDTIQQRGVAVGDYDLINYNHAYEGMSGYNGYPVVFGESKTWEAQGTKDGDKYYIYTSNANKFNITQIKISSSLFYTYIKRNGELTSGNKDILSLTLKVTGLDYDKFYLAYYYLKSADVEVRNVINITSDGIYELPKSFASDGSLTETNSYIGLSFIKKSSEIPDIIQNVNVTIEVLPEYENGLVYDGVEDYSENVNVPALTDYTYIFKRTLLNKKYNSASIFKGRNQQSGGGAFICDYNSVEPDLLTQGYSFGAGLYVDSLNADSIVYGTRGSVNGQVITSGNNTDTEGLTIGKWRAYKQMVFYKLILYPKTIPLLQINFLKNLMEKDEIIDLTNPIFIKE